MEEQSEFVKHIPCEKCGSSDANSIFTDGHQYCFACETYVNGDTDMDTDITIDHSLISGDVRELKSRSLSMQTCQKFKYMIGKLDGKPVQIATYTDEDGTAVAQKIRFADKSFRIVGNAKAMGLYGMNVWGHRGGKQIVVTEGEIDCLSVAQSMGLKWDCVSVPNGSQSAKKYIQKAYEWLSKYERIVFAFDMDEQGQKAAKECVELFPQNGYIAHLSRKDANEMIQHGETKELVNAIWSAKQYRPDGIVKAEDLWDRLLEDEVVESFRLPFSGLHEKLAGIRKSEILTVVAGSGIGKSQICREIAHCLMNQGQKIGYLALEESVSRTLLGLMSITANRRLHMEQGEVDKDELKDIFDKTVQKDRVVLYDHFGSTGSDNLLNKIRYMVRVDMCDFIVLDHLSIVVSGTDEQSTSERILIDKTMTRLRTLVQELGCGMILVNHLKRPEGNRGHEDGLATSLSHIRGSASVGQLSDTVVGAERSHHSDNPNITTLRVLKSRYSGETGPCGQISYDPETGRLTDTETFEVFDEQQDF